MNTTIETTFEIVPADSGLELSAKNSLELAFSGFFGEAARWKEHAATITEPKLARTARLELKSLRVSAEKKRKELKEESLRMGKAIDGANNILLSLIVPIEKSLEDIEKAAERAEALRIETLRGDRAEDLKSLEYSPIPENLGILTEQAWEELYQTAKDLRDLRKERERKAEEERQAAIKKEAEEREAQRLENIRLKKEAEEAAAAAKAEREAREKSEAAAKAEAAKAEKARQEAEEKSRKERLRLQAIAETERQKAAAAAEEATKKEAAAKAEAQALRDAETKRIQDEKEALEAQKKAEALRLKKAAAAPDKSKLMKFASVVRGLVVPQTATEDGRRVAAEIQEKVANFAAWIEAQAEKV